MAFTDDPYSIKQVDFENRRAHYCLLADTQIQAQLSYTPFVDLGAWIDDPLNIWDLTISVLNITGGFALASAKAKPGYMGKFGRSIPYNGGSLANENYYQDIECNVLFDYAVDPNTLGPGEVAILTPKKNIIAPPSISLGFNSTAVSAVALMFKVQKRG